MEKGIDCTALLDSYYNGLAPRKISIALDIIRASDAKKNGGRYYFFSSSEQGWIPAWYCIEISEWIRLDGEPAWSNLRTSWIDECKVAIELPDIYFNKPVTSGTNE